MLLPRLNFSQQLRVLRVSRWALAPAALLLALEATRHTWAIPGLAAAFALLLTLNHWMGSLRRQFIREARLPPLLVGKIRAAHPRLNERDADLVLRGLRQFFLAYQRSGHRFVAMPSKVVDTAWHEFILHTDAYQRWCRLAFGRMLHHTPAEVLGNDAKRNAGLRRAWVWACREESIDPHCPARLPLLFALDAKFAIAGGYRYVADCRNLDARARDGVYCGTDFDGSSGADGGFSFEGSSDSAESSSSDGGGCGGGCGGGGD